MEVPLEFSTGEKITDLSAHLKSREKSISSETQKHSDNPSCLDRERESTKECFHTLPLLRGLLLCLFIRNYFLVLIYT